MERKEKNKHRRKLSKTIRSNETTSASSKKYGILSANRIRVEGNEEMGTFDLRFTNFRLLLLSR